MAAVPTIPTKSGNVPVPEADDDLLTKFLAWFDGPTEPERKEKWAPTAEAARTELAHRRPPATEAAPATEPGDAMELAAPDPAELAALARISQPDAITQRLAQLQKDYHLVTPATHIDCIPEGFGVSVSMVHVNPDDSYNGPGEVYSVGGGKVGLSKLVLEQIGAAAGITWDPVLTGRLDNRREPRYCHFRAVGTYRLFDGTPRTITGEVEVDARDGSDVINEIITKAKERQAASNYKGKRDGGASQVLELRKFLARHAETKAKLRAIASMGVKRAYTKAELRKPFAIAKLSFTGRTNNPVLAERFALMAAESALQGSMSLYGANAPRQLPAAQHHGHDAPPVGTVADDEGQDGDELAFDAEGTSAPDGNPDNEAHGERL